MSSLQRAKSLAPVLWLAIAAVAAYVIWRRLSEIEPAQVLAQLRDTMAGATLMLSLGLTAAYWLMIGAYEVFMLHIIGVKLPWWRACAIVWIASPIGHAIGFTTFSAGALRYRLYRPQGLSARQIGALVAMSALPWLLGSGWLLDTTLVIKADAAAAALHLSPAVVITLGCIGLLKDAGYLVFVARRTTPVSLGGLEVRLPSLPATLLQATVGLIDALLVAALLYLLMPTELGLGLWGFVPVYLVAALVASVSHVPAGLGVLEASLLVMLPHVPASRLLGAVLSFRVIFELLPVLVGVILLVIYECGSQHGLAGRWWRIRKPAISEAGDHFIDESRQ